MIRIRSLIGIEQKRYAILGFRGGCWWLMVCSDGAYITLGAHERDDLLVVLQWVLKQPQVSECVLYGRSMGSVAALLVMSGDIASLGGRVKGVIADGPFKSIRSLSLDHAASNGCLLNCIAKPGLALLRKRIRKKVHLDIFAPAYRAVDQVPHAQTPALFLCASEDEICFPNHQRELYQAYGGAQKQLVEFEGTHNGARPAHVWDAMSEFVCSVVSAGAVRKPRLLAEIPDSVCCTFMPFVVKDREFVFDHSFPNPMCFRCLNDRMELFDPYDDKAEIVVFRFQDIRYLDSPGDEVLRVALGEDNGFLVCCHSALQWLKRADDTLNALLREQVLGHREEFMAKVRQAAGTLMARNPNMSPKQAASMIEEVLFGEVMQGLDAQTRATLSSDILATCTALTEQPKQ